MRKRVFLYVLVIALLISFPLSLFPRPTSALLSKLSWTPQETPSGDGRVIVTPSEINELAIASDNKTLYALDIPGGGDFPNGRVFKSTDSGITWREQEVTNGLKRANAGLPAWDIALAPDDPNILAVVTNDRTRVFLSVDGGSNWTDGVININPNIGDNFRITDIALSPAYGAFRDLAITTRDPSGTSAGKLHIRRLPSVNPWLTFDRNKDLTSLAFSPNYELDHTLLTVASDGVNTRLEFARNLTSTTPEFNWLPLFFPVILDGVIQQNEIITSQIQLPSDYNSDNHGTLNAPRIYVSYDSDTGVRVGKVRRIDDSSLVDPPMLTSDNGIASIAYNGTAESGRLLVAEALANPQTAQVKIWRTSSPTAATVVWEAPLNQKQPTGGAGTSAGFANARVIFSRDGSKIYCGTSGAKIDDVADWAALAPTPGSAGTGSSVWAGLVWDESALSVSSDNADTWNQSSLIDTGLSLDDAALIDVSHDPDKLFLTDVAISSGSTPDSGILYLVSVNRNGPNPLLGTNFDSVWRSTSQPPGRIWERVFCFRTGIADAGPILRTNPRSPKSTIVFMAVPQTENIWYSGNKGQLWFNASAGAPVQDLTLGSDEVAYLLSDYFIFKAVLAGTSWRWQPELNTCLSSGHTIAVPFTNPKGQEWVFVGDAFYGRVAYANLLAKDFQFEYTPAAPSPGKTHVIVDDKFEVSRAIYSATDGTDGRVYRWTLGVSSTWDELQPPNQSFFGLTQESGVLYGAWNKNNNLAIPSAVDRTLYPLGTVPPALEWDSLTAGLPESGDSNFPVFFTHEPISLKHSLNADIVLWAIDNRPYDFIGKKGRLWFFIDTLALAGPWALAPAPGENIPIDTVSGRAANIAFRWRPFPEVDEYEFWLAKDPEFTIMVLTRFVSTQEQDTPVFGLPPGILDVGHGYYWKVRAHRAVTGQIIRSPWSSTMFFNAMSGLRVSTPYLGPAPFTPVNGATGIAPGPLAFSWSQFQKTTEYQFQLATNADMTSFLVDARIPTTAYEYKGTLESAKSYFWRVRATNPAPSEWSPIFVFLTQAPVTTAPAPEAAQPVPPVGTPVWIWFVILVGTLVYVGIIILILRRGQILGSASSTRRSPARQDVSPSVNSDSFLPGSNPLSRIQDYLVMWFRRVFAIRRPDHRAQHGLARENMSYHASAEDFLPRSNPLSHIWDDLVIWFRRGSAVKSAPLAQANTSTHVLPDNLQRKNNPLFRIWDDLVIWFRKGSAIRPADAAPHIPKKEKVASDPVTNDFMSRVNVFSRIKDCAVMWFRRRKYL